MNKIFKEAVQFYTDLYSSEDSRNNNGGLQIRPDELDIPSVTVDEVKKALEAMERGKAADEDQITTYILKDSGHIVLEKLATLYAQCVMTSTIPEYRKNANIILIHKKGDAKDLKSYRPINLLFVAYKVFTKVIANRIRTTLESSQPNDRQVSVKATPQ